MGVPVNFIRYDSAKHRNHFAMILSTFDYHGYLLQICQQLLKYLKLLEYDFVGVCYCLRWRYTENAHADNWKLVPLSLNQLHALLCIRAALL